MKFTNLFGVCLKHPYYRDGRCSDLAIEPTPSTLRLLANYRCVLKSGPGWARVFKSDPSLIPIGKGDAFTFRLRLENPDFALFTDLCDYPSSQDPHRVYPSKDVQRVYTNASGPLTLDWRKDRRHPRPGEFATAEIFVDKAGGPGDLEIEFQRQSVKWAYYLVTDLYSEGSGLPAKNSIGEFKIVEQPVSGLPQFTAVELPAKADPTDADPIAARLAMLYPAARRIRFLSAGPVPFQQAARKIQLKVGDKELDAALPNPAPGQLVSLRSNGAAENACFQILQYLKPSEPPYPK